MMGISNSPALCPKDTLFISFFMVNFHEFLLSLRWGRITLWLSVERCASSDNGISEVTQYIIRRVIIIHTDSSP